MGIDSPVGVEDLVASEDSSSSAGAEQPDRLALMDAFYDWILAFYNYFRYSYRSEALAQKKIDELINTYIDPSFSIENMQMTPDRTAIHVQFAKVESSKIAQVIAVATWTLADGDQVFPTPRRESLIREDGGDGPDLGKYKMEA